MENCKKRALKTVVICTGILCSGIVYAYGALHWGWWLPCVFNWFTGFKCPGCGVSRMCLSLLHLDFKEAFYWNPAVLLCLPFLILILGSLCIGYIRTGNMQLGPKKQMMCWAMAGILVIYGLFRNLWENSLGIC